MLKRIFAITCAVALLAVLSSCNEKEGKTVDPKVVAAAVDKAGKTADALDNMNLKAYELGRLGAAMAEQGVPGASETLDGALKLATGVRAPSNLALATELRDQSKDWGPKDKEAIAPALDRITNDSTRVWVIRSIAEGIAKSDRAKAMGILTQAAKDAATIPNERYRDLDLRGISAALAGLDLSAGMGVAANISDPRVRSWALMEVGKTAKADGSKDAAQAFAAAGDAAEAVLKMAPSSELLTDATPADVKAKVLASDEGRLKAYAARAMANAALAMKDYDPAKSSAMFAKAEEIADSIEQPYTKSYAMSDVAMALAGSNATEADAYASKIAAGHEDAKFAAIMKCGALDTNKCSTGCDSGEMAKAVDVAESIKDPYDRAKAMELTATALANCDPKKAEEIAGKIEYTTLQNSVLASLAVAASKAGDDQFKKALDKIDEPRFAKAEAVYTKACALDSAAAIKAKADPAAAIKIYNKAATGAADANSQALQWKIAVELCNLDPTKLTDYAAKLEGDDATKATALAEIAADWSAKGDYRSPMVWDMAVKSAAAVDDNTASAELLSKIASSCAKYDKAKAAAIFGKALEKAGKIGVVQS
ncbi:MAG: hypothetical protein WA666_10455 [Nitrospirota bacterium]